MCHIPSGKRLHHYGNHHVSWVNQLKMTWNLGLPFLTRTILPTSFFCNWSLRRLPALGLPFLYSNIPCSKVTISFGVSQPYWMAPERIFFACLSQRITVIDASTNFPTMASWEKKKHADHNVYVSPLPSSIFHTSKRTHCYWLVVWTPLKNISQLGWLFPICGKIEHVPNHQPG